MSSTPEEKVCRLGIKKKNQNLSMLGRNDMYEMILGMYDHFS